jgi:hypothetical protein
MRCVYDRIRMSLLFILIFNQIANLKDLANLRP